MVRTSRCSAGSGSHETIYGLQNFHPQGPFSLRRDPDGIHGCFGLHAQAIWVQATASRHLDPEPKPCAFAGVKHLGLPGRQLSFPGEGEGGEGP